MSNAPNVFYSLNAVKNCKKVGKKMNEKKPNTNDYSRGLTKTQVEELKLSGCTNKTKNDLTPSISNIIFSNLSTFFNLINFSLALLIIIVGRIENTLFMGVVISNMVIGIFQSLKAKFVLDKLSVLSKSPVTVIRDGVKINIDQSELVLHDIVYLEQGNQVCADSIVIKSNGLEMDEALLTGESDKIKKGIGDNVLSGSFVVSGYGVVRVCAVGDANYANILTANAKQTVKKTPKLLSILNSIIKYVTITIVPLGLLLFSTSYFESKNFTTSVLGATAAMIGMIPSGLVLLTGVTMSVGAINLAKKKALVQTLPSIESLARSDVLCLDKTGTITDGSLVFKELIPFSDNNDLSLIISQLMGAINDNNSTAKALKEHFGASLNETPFIVKHFSSDRKWSGVSYNHNGSYILGAPALLFKNDKFINQQVNQLADEGFRVLCLAHSKDLIEKDSLPENLECLCLLTLADRVRDNAAETFKVFIDEGVTLKIISGDNPRTVLAVAKQAGLGHLEKYIDMSRASNDFKSISQDYSIFGHTTPEQKRGLVKAMQELGHTVCMTGDGVNDILAMRDADCSVSMAGGSEAARSACDFVLMSDDFAGLIEVLREGRRVINNIDRVAPLYLLNTLYSILLLALYVFLPFQYPYNPIQLTPVKALTTGIPTFFIALSANYVKPRAKLMENIFIYSFPAALVIVLGTVYIQVLASIFSIPHTVYSAVVVFNIGITGIFLLFKLCRNSSLKIKVMLVITLLILIPLVTITGDVFQLSGLRSTLFFYYLPYTVFIYYVFTSPITEWLGLMLHNRFKRFIK